MEIHFTDVTLRDGLQAEPSPIVLEKKLALFERLRRCGYARLEITSFVHPKWIPQLADSAELCDAIFKRGASTPKAGAPPMEFMAFVPNEKGLDRLLQYRIPWASAFVATSAAFNQKNVNKTVDETLRELQELGTKVRAEKRRWRLYVSTVFGCPYEGAHRLEHTLEILKKAADLGPDEIALSDTIGVALPEQVERILNGFLKCYPAEKTALHLHDTYGLALSCAEQGYRMGVRRFDGSTGGVGGCPYAKGASGNVASESLLYAFSRQNRMHSVPFTEILKTIEHMATDLKLTVHSRLYEIVRRGGKLYGV
ncbi:MAG: hydroxymethylglutaryl-CoA lyase [Bdellovibrionales bacterium]|nr:hydroxymethylglutaryl-CoA lyase [Bdellovibrionales bacterium]